jgi:hypothetical protein
MNLSTGIIAVTVIISVDFDLFEFILQKLKVTFEKFLEIGFYT